MVWSSSVYRYARHLPFSDSSSGDEQEVPKHYKGNVLLPMVSLAIVDDFSNNRMVLFAMNARNSYPELIAKKHPTCVEKNACFLVDLDELQDPEGAPEHRIELKAHGNAKTGCIPYLRTYRSTVAKMKDAVSRNKAGLKRVVYQVEEDVGGLENCKSGGQLPRNERQAKYLKAECQSSKAVKDPIFQITERMKEQSQTGQKFTRAR